MTAANPQRTQTSRHGHTLSTQRRRHHFCHHRRVVYSLRYASPELARSLSAGVGRVMHCLLVSRPAATGRGWNRVGNRNFSRRLARCAARTARLGIGDCRLFSADSSSAHSSLSRLATVDFDTRADHHLPVVGSLDQRRCRAIIRHMGVLVTRTDQHACLALSVCRSARVTARLRRFIAVTRDLLWP